MRKDTRTKIESAIFWRRAAISAWAILILVVLAALWTAFFPVSSEVINATLITARHVESKNPPYKGICVIRLDSGKELSLPCLPQGRNDGDVIQVSIETRFIAPWKSISVLPKQGTENSK